MLQGRPPKWEQLSVLESLRTGADHLIGTILVGLGSRAMTRLMISLTSYRTWAQTGMGRNALTAQKHRPSSPCRNSYTSYSRQSRHLPNHVLTGTSTQGSRGMPTVSRTPYQRHWSQSLVPALPQPPPQLQLGSAPLLAEESNSINATLSSQPLHKMGESHNGQNISFTLCWRTIFLIEKLSN